MTPLEDARRAMYRVAEGRRLTDPEVVSASLALDQLINEEMIRRGYSRPSPGGRPQPVPAEGAAGRTAGGTPQEDAPTQEGAG